MLKRFICHIHIDYNWNWKLNQFRITVLEQYLSLSLLKKKIPDRLTLAKNLASNKENNKAYHLKRTGLRKINPSLLTNYEINIFDGEKGERAENVSNILDGMVIRIRNLISGYIRIQFNSLSSIRVSECSSVRITSACADLWYILFDWVLFFWVGSFRDKNGPINKQFAKQKCSEFIPCYSTLNFSVKNRYVPRQIILGSLMPVF